MSLRDEFRTANERHWDRMVEEGCGYTIPWLDLDAGVLRRYARGELDPGGDRLSAVYPPGVLLDVEGRDVLCLGAGGGQQSAVFGVLGARVTVVDLSEGQLAADRKAAAHYGYDVTTLHADMQDLSALDDDAFDLVYATGMCYVPELRKVYAGVARVLRTDGLFRGDYHQPAVHFVEWDGQAYRITRPYAERIDRREDGAIEFRHDMDDIFNGLLDAGLSIERVHEPFCKQADPDVPPGSWTHYESYVAGGFVIMAKKSRRAGSAAPRLSSLS